MGHYMVWQYVHLGGLVGYSGHNVKTRQISIQAEKGCATELTIGKNHIQLVNSTFPEGIFLSGHGAFPALQVQRSLRRPLGLCDESKGVITAPLFATR